MPIEVLVRVGVRQRKRLDACHCESEQLPWIGLTIVICVAPESQVRVDQVVL